MLRLYQITIPGLSMTDDFPAARRRLLADFPRVVEVLAMTMRSTVLVAYLGEDEVDAWLDAVSDSVATRRMSRRRSHAVRRRGHVQRRMTPAMTQTLRGGPPSAVHVAAPVVTAESGPILLTGATGYVGGRLLHRLVQEGLPVRCLTRRPEILAKLVPRAVEIVAGDLLEPASLAVALAGVQIAYYLVHSMDAAGSFEELDRRAASNFADRRRQGRSTPHRLSKRPRIGRGPVCPPGQPARGRRHPASLRDRDD